MRYYYIPITTMAKIFFKKIFLMTRPNVSEDVEQLECLKSLIPEPEPHTAALRHVLQAVWETARSTSQQQTNQSY